MMGIEVKQVVITRLTTRGKGIEGDPIRRITEIWDMDGNKITEIDRFKEQEENNGK